MTAIDGRRRLRISSDVDELAGVRAFVRDAAAAAGAGAVASHNLIQAVDEAVCNVMIHGYRGSPGDIEIETEAAPDRLLVRILDRSRTFDPTSVREPDLSVAPMARKPGGMGIHLLRTMVDEVHHRARPGGGNELTLVQVIHDPAAED